MPDLPKKNGFTLIELLIVIVIIGILAAIGLATFTSSQMKSRDAKRKADLQQVSRALELYYNDKGQYPADDGSGNIMGCGAGAITACTWGSLTVPFSNTTTGTIYMTKLPADPSQYTYYYVATPVLGRHPQYQLYARLENLQDQSIIVSGYNCATGVKCNYGVSSSNITPSSTPGP
jgi:type II secretion system protein G